MTDSLLVQIVKSFQRVPEAQRAGLLMALQDAASVHQSLQYLRTAPAPLCGDTLKAHLIQCYAVRWGLEDAETATVLQGFEEPDVPAANDQAEAFRAAEDWVSALAAELSTYLAQGWTAAALAQALTERGQRVGRGVIKQLAQGRHLHKATKELRAALLTLPGRPPVVTAQIRQALDQYGAALEQLAWTGPEQLTGFLASLPQEAAEPVWNLVETIYGQPRADLNPQLALPGPDYASAAQVEALGDLTTYLRVLAQGQALQEELHRIQELGWSMEQLTPFLRQAGYSGPALHDPLAMPLNQLCVVTTHLQALTVGPHERTEAPQGAAPLKMAEARERFLSEWFLTQTVIRSQDIAPVFGLSLAEAMAFLRSVSWLQPVRQGLFRRRS
ncbi:hypothetical protein [Deinococcus multiflagellatus]|uniref:Uncharacterized protein n=1 Tax=Deinococcus multiflagellatus TaxID=1656887 RepID=A0ABW1ZNK8_9DEIO|nr:hypothetical protein [Deinococcus multiflagellatus]MBZ9714887.1 hypothetical protein [Deinococcus multiflagellatus]